MYLLNAWHILTKHIKEVVEDLQNHAKIVNGSEQGIQSQRAFRQSQATSSNSTRSLSQLTGQPAIFAHIHLWFCWILNIKIATEKLNFPTELVYNTKSCTLLRAISQDMGEEVFSKALYCCLTGVKITCDSSILKCLKTLLPINWSVISNDKTCEIYKANNLWEVVWIESLPNRLPTLQVQIMKALSDFRLPDDALDMHFKALIFQWHNVVKTLCNCSNYNKNLLQSLGVQTYDFPLLLFWIYHCTESPQKYQIIIDNLRKVLMK